MNHSEDIISYKMFKDDEGNEKIGSVDTSIYPP